MDIENTQSVAESNRKRAALIKKLAEQKRAQMLAKKQSKITARQIGSNTLPLSFAQQRLWFLDKLSDQGAEYNISGGFTVRGEFNVVAAQQAIQQIITRHEVLRTTYDDKDGEPIQIIQATPEFAMTVYDLSRDECAPNANTMEELLQRECEKPFDLSTDVMLRASYISLPREQEQAVGVLLFSMHHIASDGWSMEIVTREFVAEYQAQLDDRPASVVEPEIQYGDFALWQRQHLDQQVLQKQLEYWQHQLEGMPAVHRLPMDYPRPDFKRYQGLKLSRRLEGSVSRRALMFAKEHGLTPFMLFHAVLNLMMARCSNQAEFVVGTPAANRMKSELKQVVGFFVNTLVLKANVDASSVNAYLEHIKEVNLDAQSNQDIPFEQIVEHCVPARSAQYTPLFQVLLSTTSGQNTALELPHLELLPIERKGVVAKFDIDINVALGEQGGQIKWVYDSAIFKPETITQFADFFECTLISLLNCDDLSLPLSRINMITDAERTKLVTPNQPQFEGQPLADHVHLHFSAQAQKLHNQTALISQNNHISYQTVDSASTQMAIHLQELGVGAGDIVAVSMIQNERLIYTILGIMKLGAAYLPVSPDLPKARLQYIFDDASVSLVITSEEKIGLDKRDGLKVICFDDDFEQRILNHYVTEGFEPHQGDPSTLPSYVIYTSGSTGNPKGVVISQQSALQFGLYMGQRFAIDSNCRVLQFATISFDAFIMEWQWALLNGGSLHFCDPQCKTDPAQLSSFLQQQSITHTLLPPTLLRHLPYHDNYDFKALLVGGEACDEGLAEQWAGRYPMFNAYGPTESTVCASIAELKPQHQVTIGTPVDFTQLFVLSRDGQPLPKGLCGELVIAGSGLALGYLNKSELTLQKFITNPFGAGRWYFTGDIARQNSRGEFEYLGRIDDQVSIKGFRIEPEEVKQQLLLAVGVTAAEVVVEELAAGQRRLLAYIVASNEVVGSDGELIASVKAQLHERLPNYMIPAGFAVLDALPVTQSGKVDKQALPKIDMLAQQESYQAPSNDIEHQLVELYAQLLGLSPQHLSVTSNFFELGGDSILSIQLVSRAARVGLYFSVKQLFSYQTIAALAAHVSTSQVQQVSQQPSAGTLPLLPIHQAFFMDEAGLNHFNQAVMLGCQIQLTKEFLTQVVTCLVVQHDALRLRFKHQDTGWVGEFADTSSFDIDAVLSVINVDNLNSITGIADELQQSLNITVGPLFKVVLFTDPKQQQRLLIICHHLIIDGVSWRILLEDFERCLDKSQELTHHALFELGQKTTAYQTWCEYLDSWPNLEQNANEIAYWREQLALPVPSYRRGETSEAYISNEFVGSLQFALDKDYTSLLLQRANSTYRTQINELLIAALLRGFSLWSEQSIMRIDLEGHGREELDSGHDLSRTIGWFTTSYPLTLEAPDGDLEALICAVKEQYRAIPNKGLGFGLLARAGLLGSNVEPHAEIVFNYLGQFKQVINEQSLLFAVEEGTGRAISPHRKLTHGLSFNGKILAEQLQFNLSYDKNGYSCESLQKLNQLIVRSLEEIIQHCCDVEAGIFTASDFPLATVQPQELKSWTQGQAIQDIYATTPMQEGMLYHSHLERGAYANQLFMEVIGEVDLGHLRAAWQCLVDRYDIFRTGFRTSELGIINQIVHQQVTLPWQEFDLSQLDVAEQQAIVNQMRAEDKAEGFNVNMPPLVRVTVWQLAPQHYQLLWTQHHALIDGWCSGIVFSELLAIYHALSNKRDIQLSPAVPYKNYIAWLQSKDSDKAEQFWRTQVGQITERSHLPFSRYLEQPDYVVAREYLQLTVEQTNALTLLAKQTRTTLNVVLQAAWALLLSRANRSKQVTFGTTVSGRPADLNGVESMVGLFINTVPAVISLDSEQSVSELLLQLQSDYIERDEYSYFPLSKIQKLSSEHAGRGLFDSLLVFENYPRSLSDASRHTEQSLQIKNIESQQGNNFPLSLIASHGEVLKIKFEYHSNHYSKHGIEQLRSCLGEILTAMSHGSDKPISTLAWLTKAQQQAVLVNSGYGRQTQTSPSFIATLKHQFASYPEAEAVYSHGVSTNYRALNTIANQIATQLSENGIGKQSRVGICLEKGVGYLASIIATFKVGAAFVPLEKEWPTERLAFIAQDAQLDLTLTEPTTQHAMTKSQRQLCITKLASEHIEFEGDIPHANDIAYIIYTSGTTGKPKGVAVSHGNISHYVDAMLSRHAIAQHSRFALLTSFATDLGYTSILLALATAGSVDIGSRELIQSGDSFTQHILAREINVIKLTPSLLAALLTHYDGKLTSLNHVFVGGEAIQSDARQVIRTLLNDGVEVINHYGPTETTIGACTQVINDVDAKPIAIGRPISGMRACVLDDNKELVPDGIVGELYLSGSGVALGYIKQSSLTDQYFTLDPWASDSSRRYATGDLVYRDESGDLVYVGRKDNQIKVRGFRVELEEIELTLLRSPSVSTAVVILNSEQTLVAYIKLKAGAVEQQSNLLNLAQQWLPHYMVPSAIVFVEDIPLKSNGKVDKSALPSVQKNVEKKRAETPLELTVARAWAQYLGCDAETIGVEENFYDLGGDSVKMILVIGLLKKQGITIAAQQMSKINTIAGVVELVEGQGQAPKQPESVVLLGQQAEEVIFAIHPYGGRVDNYRQLAAKLQPEYQLLGLQAPYNYQSDYRFDSAKQLAERYVEEILVTQPKGPYRIIGWSAGGTLAHLVAATLQQRGRNVAYLGMIDSLPIGISRKVKSNHDYLLNSARYIDKHIATKLAPTCSYSYDELMQAIIESIFSSQPDFPLSRDVLTAALQFGVDLGRSLATAQAMQEPLDLAVELFKATASEGGVIEPASFTQAFKQPLKVHEFETTHASLLEGDAVVMIADLIKQSLKRKNKKNEGVTG
ncbi:non-ribosomal peptide synthetase [Pseudoalteromonas sp. JC3]|uniref:non-ribosomal peptide synthetase n=1 Tax=Pseudoalteromonas sp. JC3 TaxID=2810196 RepID=UPI0019D2EEB0|nr:non-ribosomal peptide synthetase [Pseudoalteromonas sp. JC3]MBR8843002.1 amino acid adenylation domain-containing protein [Pseudoalteromonas sp. JC3]WJE09638.1 non-ribosomal peptide synthetase [Pseudoalteromonas sp. JC3]